MRKAPNAKSRASPWHLRNLTVWFNFYFQSYHLILQPQPKSLIQPTGFLFPLSPSLSSHACLDHGEVVTQHPHVSGSSSMKWNNTHLKTVMIRNCEVLRTEPSTQKALNKDVNHHCLSLHSFAHCNSSSGILFHPLSPRKIPFIHQDPEKKTPSLGCLPELPQVSQLLSLILSP